MLVSSHRCEIEEERNQTGKIREIFENISQKNEPLLAFLIFLLLL